MSKRQLAPVMQPEAGPRVYGHVESKPYARNAKGYDQSPVDAIVTLVDEWWQQLAAEALATGEPTPEEWVGDERRVMLVRAARLVHTSQAEWEVRQAAWNAERAAERTTPN